jgi:response regulator RpfG family c-di-GMP phosphodiesterase
LPRLLFGLRESYLSWLRAISKDRHVGLPPAQQRVQSPESIVMSQIIVVVDDEPAICTFVETVLQLDGCVVVTAESGPEALNVLSRRTVGVLVTDMTMPNMNGAELAERVKQSWRSCTSSFTTVSCLPEPPKCGSWHCAAP